MDNVLCVFSKGILPNSALSAFKDPPACPQTELVQDGKLATKIAFTSKITVPGKFILNKVHEPFGSNGFTSHNQRNLYVFLCFWCVTFFISYFNPTCIHNNFFKSKSLVAQICFGSTLLKLDSIILADGFNFLIISLIFPNFVGRLNHFIYYNDVSKFNLVSQ